MLSPRERLQLNWSGKDTFVSSAFTIHRAVVRPSNLKHWQEHPLPRVECRNKQGRIHSGTTSSFQKIRNSLGPACPPHLHHLKEHCWHRCWRKNCLSMGDEKVKAVTQLCANQKGKIVSAYSTRRSYLLAGGHTGEFQLKHTHTNVSQIY